MAETFARIKRKTAPTKWQKRFSWFWSVLFVWVAINLMVEVAQKLEVINAIAISVCIVFSFIHLIRWELDGQYWSKWENVKTEEVNNGD